MSDAGKMLMHAVHVQRVMREDGRTEMHVYADGSPSLIEMLGLLEYAKLEFDRRTPEAEDR